MKVGKNVLDVGIDFVFVCLFEFEYEYLKLFCVVRRFDVNLRIERFV